MDMIENKNRETKLLQAKLSYLKELSLISAVIGNVYDKANYGLILWANRPPGPGFDISINLTKYISGATPTIVLDDLLPKAVYHRDDSAQNEVNNVYLSFFKYRNCKVFRLSEMHKQLGDNQFFSQFLDFSDKVSIKDFLNLLPEKKKAAMKSLTFLEVIHMIDQLFTLELAVKYLRINTVITPQFNQAVYMLHRDISKTPISAIVTPPFGKEEEGLIT